MKKTMKQRAVKGRPASLRLRFELAVTDPRAWALAIALIAALVTR